MNAPGPQPQKPPLLERFRGREIMMGAGGTPLVLTEGFEPSLSTLKGWRLNQFVHASVWWEGVEVEPLTSNMNFLLPLPLRYFPY